VTSSIIAGLIVIWLAIEVLLRKRIGWVDALLLITLGYICGSNETTVGAAIHTGIDGFIAAFNFISSWFE
jgi:hypothetical protein